MTTSASVRTTSLIDGAFVPRGDDVIDVVNPATEERIASVSSASAGDVDTAVTAARRAFESWSQMSAEERVTVFQRIVNGISARADEFASTMTAEMGTAISFSRRVQVPNPIAIANGTIEVVQNGFFDGEQIENSLILHEPVGVVGAITPWNFPLQQVIAKVAPAVLAGNTVVLKPSQLSPLTAGLLGEVAQAAGLPAGVLNILYGEGRVLGEALAAHPDLDMISLTGSTAAGRRVSVLAADTVKRVALELGGKSANVLLDDGDLATGVKVGVANCFMNNGQACSALSRLLVPAKWHDEALELAVAAAGKYVPGDPADPATRIGPAVSARQRDGVVNYIRSGIADGAVLACGGPEPVDLPGYYVRPTVFGAVTPDMTVAYEEIFGPVLVVMPYEDVDDAVRIANSTRYGLAAAVSSGDPGRALAVARRLRAGQVHVNGAAFNVKAPFGGYGESGNGRELGAYGLAEFCEVKAIQR